MGLWTCLGARTDGREGIGEKMGSENRKEKITCIQSGGKNS